jgi:GT2 family glycosyltransferase
MKASVIIPVWNGAEAIRECLRSMYSACDPELLEVICINNASQDESERIILNEFPQVRLLSQPINLGFAGGVNKGMEAALGDVFVLLNQDCVIKPYWLAALVRCLTDYPKTGIVGSIVLNADGNIDHAGALISHPKAEGIHLKEIGSHLCPIVEYVTGASMAIRRELWEKIGGMDEGYHPAYYEDTDYCYRARYKSFEIRVATESVLVHMRSSQRWLSEPIRYAVESFIGQYRFVGKHFSREELSDFFIAQIISTKEATYLNETVGRFLAAKHTLASLPALLKKRQNEQGKIPTDLEMLLSLWLKELARDSLQRAKELATKWVLEQTGTTKLLEKNSTSTYSASLTQLFEELKQREAIVKKALEAYTSPLPQKIGWQWWQSRYQRAKGILSGHESALHTELSNIQTSKLQMVDELLNLFTIIIENEIL